MINIQNYVRAQSLEEAYTLNQKKSTRILGGMLWLKMAKNTVGTAVDLCRLGLDAIDHRMLRSIIDNYRGGPVGLDTLAATINEEAVTLEDVYEPYLMQLGFLTRTPRGRCVTPKAYQHLGLPVPGGEISGGLDQLSF